MSKLTAEQTSKWDAEHKAILLRDRNAPSVYVLIALDDDARVRECVVLTDSQRANELYAKLRLIWGGAHVAMASRRVDDLPVNLVDPMQALTDIDQQRAQDIQEYESGEGYDPDFMIPA